MKITEVKKDLFDVFGEFHYVHCISSDYALGAGIAVEFDKRFDMRRKLLEVGDKTYPASVLVDNVFNLVTKEKYWHKPTYSGLEIALRAMKRQVEALDIKYLAMPRIGSGLDRLEWPKVKDIIVEVFRDSDVKILVCFL